MKRLTFRDIPWLLCMMAEAAITAPIVLSVVAAANVILFVWFGLAVNAGAALACAGSTVAAVRDEQRRRGIHA